MLKISKENIIQYYKNLGYFNVDVEAETEKINKKNLVLKYIIKPNERYLIDSIKASIESQNYQFCMKE